MKINRFISVMAIISASALGLTACGSAGNEEYPSKAIDLTIPFGPGGATDLAARAMAEALSNEFDQPVNPTNREGANQITAVTYVSHAKPDGYTLLADGGGSSTLQSLLTDLPYKWDDRTFIARVASGGHAYAVGASSGITNMDELVDKINEDPAKFSVAWMGGSSTSDFATLQLLNAIDVDPNDVKFVPFSGTGDAMQAAAAGDVDLASGGSSAIAALYSSGDLVPLALTAPDPNFPELPLTKDEGYEELNMRYWVGLSGPANMPDEVVDKLTSTLKSLEDNAAMTKTFDTLGMTVEIVTGDDLAAYIKDEAAKFAQLNDLVSE